MALPNLGPMMSMEDPKYISSAGYIAGASERGPDCECPGFDSGLMSHPEALLGRWVRSPVKFVGWDTYMEFFGLTGNKALQETEEPQEHVFLFFSKSKFRIVHRLPWRDGLDCEYTIPIDGSKQPIPPAMVARASSSWKVNDLACWVHAWDDGKDGNPLHRGMRTEQKMSIKDVDYTLRYWRNLIGPREMRVNVEVTYADTGKYAVHTQRFFHKIDVDRAYAIACVQPTPALSLDRVTTWTHAGRAVRLAVLPHESNMPGQWERLSPAEQWELAEPFPSAGRSSGPFLSVVRSAARDAGLWVCCGLVLRAKSEEKALLRGVALIGADGWLHAVHTDASPKEPYAKGDGDWPAPQFPRVHGVYDTALGRLAMCAEPPTGKAAAELAAMGAELVITPPAAGAPASRVAVALPTADAHANLTRYELCGPDALPLTAAGCEPSDLRFVCAHASDESGKLSVGIVTVPRAVPNAV